MLFSSWVYKMWTVDGNTVKFNFYWMGQDEYHSIEMDLPQGWWYLWAINLIIIKGSGWGKSVLYLTLSRRGKYVSVVIFSLYISSFVSELWCKTTQLTITKLKVQKTPKFCCLITHIVKLLSPLWDLSVM